MASKHASATLRCWPPDSENGERTSSFLGLEQGGEDLRGRARQEGAPSFEDDHVVGEFGDVFHAVGDHDERAPRAR